MFKSIGRSESVSDYEYRDCYAPTPTEALLQTWVLTVLSSRSDFAPPPSVYSYRWAHKRSGHLFQPYIRGYLARNRDAANALSDDAGQVAVIADIRQFYPSMNRAAAYQTFMGLVGRADLTNEEANACGLAAENLLQATENGIPIGPPLSHLLGQVSLFPLDAYAERNFPGQYFRYVDDIILATTKRDSRSALDEVSDQLALLGLELNPKKTEFVDGRRWRARFLGAERLVGEKHSFAELVSKIIFFLLRKPESFDELRTRMRDEGFCLPLARLRAKARYGRFHQALRLAGQRVQYHFDFVEKPRQSFSDLIASWSDTTESITTFALGVRRNFLIAAETLAYTTPDDAVETKWHAQECRFVFNRLLYLLNPHGYGKFADWIPEIPELFELTRVVKALRTEDPTGVLALPGACSKAFCEISREVGAKYTLSAHVLAHPIPTRALRDSLAHMLQYGVGHMTSAFFEGSSSRDQLLLQFCQGHAPEVRELRDFSFLDEVRTLQLGTSRETLDQILDTRFSDAEEISLEALHLGGSQHYS